VWSGNLHKVSVRITNSIWLMADGPSSCMRNSHENLGTRNLSVCRKFSCEFFLVRKTWMN